MSIQEAVICFSDGAAVQQDDGAAAVVQFFGPNLEIAVLLHPASLNPKGILIDGDHFLVEQDLA